MSKVIDLTRELNASAKQLVKLSPKTLLGYTLSGFAANLKEKSANGISKSLFNTSPLELPLGLRQIIGNDSAEVIP